MQGTLGDRRCAFDHREEADGWERNDVLLSEDVGAVRRLTLNRPASLNALSDELLEALDEALAAAAADDASVRVLILRGAAARSAPGTI